jgi:hypothetical protein
MELAHPAATAIAYNLWHLRPQERGMPAKKLDITIEQGATFIMNVTWKNPAGVPVNLTGYTAKMQARLKYSDATALATFSTADSTITLGGALGTIAVSGPAALTGITKPVTGVYDLELTETATGKVTRLLQGRAYFSPEVTK